MSEYLEHRDQQIKSRGNQLDFWLIRDDELDRMVSYWEQQVQNGLGNGNGNENGYRTKAEVEEAFRKMVLPLQQEMHYSENVNQLNFDELITQPELPTAEELPEGVSVTVSSR